MKSKITYNSLKVIVNSKNNKLENIEGDEILKSLITEYFHKAISVITPTESDLGLMGSKQEILKPGDNDYILAVLIDIIQNQLHMDIEYNIKE